jgi:hypothetical protein
MNWLKVAKLVRMLSSPNEGEVVSAARILTRMGIHKIAARLESPEVPGGTAPPSATAVLPRVRHWIPRTLRRQDLLGRVPSQISSPQEKLTNDFHFLLGYPQAP